MSHSLAESAVWGPTVTVPDDGDTEGVASVNGAFSTLANRTQLIGGASQSPTTKYPLGSRTLTRWFAGSCSSDMSSANRWTPNANGIWTAATTSTCTLIIPVSAPDGCTLNTCAVYVASPNAVTAVAGNRMTFTLKDSIGATAGGNMVSVTDSTNLAGSIPVHAITASFGIGVVYTQAVFGALFIVLSSESGTNAVAGDQFVSASVTFTTTGQDDGAS